MAVSGIGAAYFASVAERARGCIFAANCRSLGDMARLPGMSYVFGGAPPFTNNQGALFSATADRVTFGVTEFGRQVRGSTTPLTILAKVSLTAYVSGAYQLVCMTEGGATPIVFGFNDAASTSAKNLVLYRNAGSGFQLSTATVATPLANALVGCTISSTGVITFYANGIALGSTVAGATGAATSAGTLFTIGNGATHTQPLGGRLRWLRIFRAELSAAEVARYA